MEISRLDFMRSSAALGVAGFAALGATSAPLTIVLVHGAFANGSSWDRVIPILLNANLAVVAVHLPLSSLADDVAAVNRAVADRSGPVLLVGHSYAGMVITQAGGVDAVRGLVYVDGFAPSEGESVETLTKPYPPPPASNEIRADKAGYLTLTPAGVAQDFAQDLAPADQALILATQGPIFNSCFATPVTVAAWRTKPSWSVYGGNDRSIQPALHAASAKKIGAKTTVLPNSSHLPMLSHPREVAAVIVSAAASS